MIIWYYIYNILKEKFVYVGERGGVRQGGVIMFKIYIYYYSCF